jgi:hypothetical protein
VNATRCRTSGCIQRAAPKTVLDDRRDCLSAPSNKKENAMLRTFTAALLATALVAGPALAAQPSGDAGTAPKAAAAATAPAATSGQPSKQTEVRKPINKPAKMVRHSRSHVRHHTAHVIKPGKVAKSTKSSA